MLTIWIIDGSHSHFCINICMKDRKSKCKTKHIKPADVSLKPFMCTTRLCDLYIKGTFKTKDELALMNNSLIQQSYESLIIKDLVGPGRKLQGIPRLIQEPAFHSVSVS